MEQVIVTKPSGATIELFNRANGTTLTKAELRKTLMGENVAVLGVQSAVPLQFGLGDRLTVFGQPYKLNSLPVTNKKGNRLFAYELTFEGVEYDLLGVKYFDAGPDGSYVQGGGFPLTGNLRKFLDVLVYNTRRKFSPGTWVVGDCPVTDYRDMLFNGENCLSALQRLCAEYKQEFEVVSLNGVNTIHVREVGVTLNNVFEYGRGKGLYGITRKMQEKKTPVTVLYAYGSGKNLRSDYRNYSQRLKLPNNTLSKITDQALVDSVGYFEEEVVFENIFPRRTGTVTALGSDYTKFADTVAGDNAMFDLNATDGNGSTLYLIADKYAKVHFNTGKLAGYEFDISAYNHASKTFTIIPFTDERGQKFPDDQTAAFRVGVGDEYVILDIRMPQTYIDAAEQELQAAAELYYAQNSGPKPEYDIVVDDLYMRDHAFAFSPGDQVHIRDIDMGIDGLIRVKGIVRDLLYPNKFKLTVTDNLEYSRLEKLLSQQSAASAAISSNGLNNTAKTVRNGTDMTSVLTIFAEMFEKRTDSTGKPFIYAKSDLVAKGGMMMYGAVEANIPSLWDGLPIASTTVLGGIKVGANLSIDANGFLNAQAGGSGVSSWNDLQDKPAWLQPLTQGAFEAAHAHPFSQLTNKPTTLAGYGITDAAVSSHVHTFASLTSKPTTIAGFGITDAYTKTNMQTSGAALLHWGNLTNVPATFAPSAHSHDYLPLAGGQLTGQLVLPVEGLRFPNDAFGGGGDTAGLRLVTKGGEAMTLELYTTNDADDTINFSVPSINGVTVNGSVIWNAGNFNPASKSDAAHLHTGVYEPVVSAGTSTQYLRGDKTWQTLNTAAVPESSNQYFTNSRAVAAVSGNATKVAGQFYTGTTNPTNTNRLNFDGYLYGTRLYSSALQVATLADVETLTNKTLSIPTLTNATLTGLTTIQSDSYPALKVLRTTTNTGAINSGFGLITETSGVPVDGFGGGFVFAIKTGGVEYTMGTMAGVRDGNNSSGAITFNPVLNSVRTERMRVAANGNVGIGTTTLSQKLSVNGNIITYSPYNDKSVFIGVDTSWGGAEYPTIYNPHSNDRWIMHQNPHIVWMEQGQRGYNGNTYGAQIRFEGGIASPNYWDIGALSITPDKFGIRVGGQSTALLSINTGGSVDIGGTLNTIGGVDGGVHSRIQYEGVNNIWSFVEHPHYGIGYKQGSGDDIRFYFGDKNNPKFKFDIDGNLQSLGNIETKGGQFRILDASGNIKWSIGFNSSNNDLVFYNSTGAKAASIDQSGNLYQVGTVIMYSTR